MLGGVAREGFVMTAPVLLATATAAFVATASQVGVRPIAKRIAPDASKISPAAGCNAW